jgi:hypothetical protein
MPIIDDGSSTVWSPAASALHRAVWADPDDARPTTILLRHPTAPFVQWLDTDDETALQACAHRYLIRANEIAALALPAPWLQALDPEAEPDPEFGWLPLDLAAHGEPAEAAASFRFIRAPDGAEPDRTDVLLAGERINKLFLGSEFGIRVVAHVRKDAARGYEVRITSTSASLPFGAYRYEEQGIRFWAQADPGKLTQRRDELMEIVTANLRLEPGTAFIRALRLGRAAGPQRAFEARGRALGVRDAWHPEEPALYDFVAAGTISDDLDFLQTTFLERLPLSAAAQPG